MTRYTKVSRDLNHLPLPLLSLCSHPEVLQTFLREVGGRYLPNPYHNLWHAGDVLYTTWRFIHDSKAVLWLTKLGPCYQYIEFECAFISTVVQGGASAHQATNVGRSVLLVKILVKFECAFLRTRYVPQVDLRLKFGFVLRRVVLKLNSLPTPTH